ncbi:MAG: ribosome small subunit-dependent GTPase A [Candidatus Phytoplasma sp. TWB_XP]
MEKALVLRFLAGVYYIKDLETQIILEAKKRGKLKSPDIKTTQKENSSASDFIIKVGDIVFYELSCDTYLIQSILPRKNELRRPNVANIDQVLLVFSLVKPNFQFLLLDKFLLILEQQKLDVVLVFSKIDLLEPENLTTMQQQLSYYQKFQPFYYINSKQKIGIDALKHIFANQITVLAGQTGVGKSTLLKALIPDAKLKTQEISESLGRGKHTTKNAQLYEFNGGFIVDTPGFSKLDLTTFCPRTLKNFYPDFVEHVCDCFFGESCLHLQEEKCGVKKALENGKILPSRYQNYVSFYEEIKNQPKY